MARIVPKKSPIDQEAGTAVGFGFPLNGGAVFVPTYTTQDQIKANLINFILTNTNERVFRPNFGANLRALLFEQINDGNLDDLRDNIESIIQTYFPSIIIEEIKFQNQPDDNLINFILVYSIRNFGVTDSLNIQLQ